MTAPSLAGPDPQQGFLRLLSGTDRRQAVAWFESLWESANCGHTLWSCAETVERFLQQCSRTGSSETRDGYARELRHLAAWLEQNASGVPLRLLDPGTAEKAIADLRQLVADGTIQPRTFNRRASVWSALWRWASEPNRCGLTGFMRSIWPRRMYYAVEKVSRPLAESELADLTGTIAHAARQGLRTASRDLAMIRLAYLTGVRVSELCALRWSDIEAVEGGAIIHVRRGKGGKARSIRVSRETLQLVESLGRGEPEGFLFPSCRREGQPLTRQAAGDRARRWGAQIGVRVWMHRLRHTHASVAVARKVNTFVLAQTLGHASVSTTQGYVKTCPSTSSSLALG